MAKVSNPRKRFLWQLTFVKHPLNPYLFQNITLPEINVEQVEHGDVNYSVKTGGRVTTGNLMAEKLLTTSGSDTWFLDFLYSVQDPFIGGGLIPDQYKESVKVDELAEDGVSILNSWILTGVWATRLNGQELNRMSSDNTVDTIEFSVDLMEKV